MGIYFEIARSGFASILLHPLRNLVTALVLVLVLTPWLTGLGMSAGIHRDALISIGSGGDLYVSGMDFGHSRSLPVSLVTEIQKLPGVIQVTPRIVGRITLGREAVDVVILGLPASELKQQADCLTGHLPEAGATNEFVVGTELAERLSLREGTLLPPFYRNPQGERVSRVVGVFTSDVALWQSQLMLTTIDTAERVFSSKDLATDLVVRCRSGYAESIREAVLNMSFTRANNKQAVPPLKVVTRESLNLLLAEVQQHRGGVFNLHFVIVFVGGILSILVTSGVGLPERRKEIGLLKAIGWQTDQVLFRCLVECFIVAVVATSLTVVFSWIWGHVFNGWFIAAVFFPGTSTSPQFQVPFQLTPVLSVFALIISLTVVLTGSLWSVWRAATVSPAEAMR